MHAIRLEFVGIWIGTAADWPGTPARVLIQAQHTRCPELTELSRSVVATGVDLTVIKEEQGVLKPG